MNKTLLSIMIIVFIVTLFLSPVQGEEAKLIDLDFKNTDIRDVLRALASQEGVNIYIDNDISGNITISLTKVTFVDALRIITQNNHLTYTHADRVYYIKPIDDSSLNINFKDGLLEVDAKKTRLSTLWEMISKKTGTSLLPGPGLEERISISLTPTPLEDAIQAILTQSHCLAENIGSVTLIKKKTTPQLPFTIVYENSLLTIDAQNIPLAVLCRAITEKTGVSVVPDQNASQNVTVYLQNLSLGESLSLLCQTNDLLLHREDSAWRITRLTGAFRIRLHDNLLSVTADNVDIAILLKEISNQSGQNIILDREVRGTVTAHFQDLQFYQGLAVLLENQGWILEKQDTYLYVRVNPNQTKTMRLVYDPEQQLFDLDIQTAPIAVVLNEMARRANLNIVILAQVNWTINNLRLQKMSFTQVMDFLFKGTIFTYTLIEDTYLIGDGLIVRPENRDFAIIKVYPIKYLKSDQFLNTLPPVFPRQNFIQLPEKNALIVSAPQNIHDLFEDYLAKVDTASIEDRTEVIRINYLKAEDVLKLIPSSISKNDLMVVKEVNAIAVTGPQNLINQVKSYIQKIDQINPLILFNIMVLQIEDSDNLFWGGVNATIKLSNSKELYLSPANGGLTLRDIDPKAAGNSASLSAETTKAKILANPSITTLNGYPASFNVSTNRSYTVPTETTTVDKETTTTNEVVKTYSSGLFISITPWVSASNQITMEIKPKISEFGAAPENSDLPTTTERATETTVRVKDGETIVISGLKNSRFEHSVSKVPLLGDIPIIGNLFKKSTTRESQDEFIVIITPHLIFDQNQQQNEVQILNFSEEVQKTIKSETVN